MEIPKSVLGLVMGLVLLATVSLAATGWFNTQSQAQEATVKNAAQDTSIKALEIYKDAQADDLKWLKEAMILVLRDRGIKPPKE